MDFRYDSYRDAIQQIDNTVMMTEAGPIWVSHHDTWKFRTRKLEDYESDIVDIRKVGLTFKPILLGYVNFGYALSYIVRNPRRMWKQGISYDNIKATYGEVHGDMLEEASFFNTVMGNFPSLTYSIRQAEEGMSTAFHREFAIIAGDELEVHYKGTNIGMIKDDEMHINDKYLYLKELIEEVLHEKG